MTLKWTVMKRTIFFFKINDRKFTMRSQQPAEFPEQLLNITNMVQGQHDKNEIKSFIRQRSFQQISMNRFQIYNFLICNFLPRYLCHFDRIIHQYYFPDILFEDKTHQPRAASVFHGTFHLTEINC